MPCPQAAAGDPHWRKCFNYVTRMVAAVPEEQRKTRPQQTASGDKAAAGEKAAADAAGKPAADKPAAAEEKAAEEKAAEAAPDAKVHIRKPKLLCTPSMLALHLSSCRFNLKCATRFSHTNTEADLSVVMYLLLRHLF